MKSPSLTGFIREARRRRLFGVLALYIVGAWVALQAADLAFPGWQIPDFAIRYVWIGAILLFPVAVCFGWRYDVTARGIQKTPPVSSDACPPLQRSDHVILAGLLSVTALICLTAFNYVLDARVYDTPRPVVEEIPPNSIAVLPFVNMSDDESNEYFSDGISEQLLNELSRIPELHVAARTSAFFYKNKNEPMQKMGQELGVRTLLEGSVRKSGNIVRITAQLINASDGYHLWSATYDRELDEVFAVQDEIARAITNTLKIELLIDEQQKLGRGGTDNAQAYDLYLRGIAFLRLRAPDSVDGSAELFQQALDLDPDFALALDALAYSYVLKTYDGSMSIEDATKEALPLIGRALEIQPDLEQAHASLGMLKSRSGLYEESDAHFRTAIDINPNYFQGQVNFGLSLVLQSRLKEAAAAYLRALVLDPMNANLNFNLGALMMLQGQFDDGLQFIEKSLSIEPERRIVRMAKSHWLAQYGHLVEAVRIGRATLEAYPDFGPNVAALVTAYVYLGMIDEAEALLDNANQQMPDNTSIRRARWVFAGSTGNDDAFVTDAKERFEKLDKGLGDPLNFDQKDTVRLYGWALLLQDRNEEAANILDWAVGGEEGIAATTYDRMAVIKLLALSYQRLDRNAEASALLDRCLELVNEARDSGWGTPVLHVRLAEVYVQKGLIDQAIDSVAIAVEKGYRDLQWLENGIFWRQLQDHPDLNELKVRIYEDIEAQRAVLRQDSSQVAFLTVSPQRMTR